MASVDVQQALVLASSIGAAAYTVSSTEITKGLRSAVVKRSLWLGKLITCPYCLSHWLAFGAVAVYRPYLVDLRSAWTPLVVLDFLVTALALLPVSMAAVLLVKAALGKATQGPAAPASAARSAKTRVPDPHDRLAWDDSRSTL